MSTFDIRSNGSKVFRSNRIFSYASTMSSERAHFQEVLSKNANSRQQMFKLLMVMALPVLTLLGFTIKTLVDVSKNFAVAEKSVSVVYNNLDLANLIGSMQKERGLSAMYLSNPNPDVHDVLQKTRTDTERLLWTLTQWPEITVWGNKTISTHGEFLSHLEIMRHLINNVSVTVEEDISFYTENNKALVEWMMQSLVVDGFSELQKLHVANNALLLASDVVGIQRALGSMFFASCGFSIENLRWFALLDGEGSALINTGVTYFPSIENTLQHELEKNADIMANLTLMKNLMWGDSYPTECNTTSQNERVSKSLFWFNTITRHIDILLALRKDVSTSTTISLNDVISSSERDMVLYVCVSVFILIACVSLSFWYATRIREMTKNIQSYTQKMETKKRELALEKKRSEALLYQMLPQQVADQLKMRQEVEAEVFEAVTIYFSDIVGFTELAGKSSPLEVVDLLNTLYRFCDDCIDRYDVYKVETIGDAYMVVSGLPRRNGSQHSTEIADMSLDILQSSQHIEVPHLPDEKIKIRIGLHSGPCVAGVVGNKMPRYCLFGDTVNTASRMESTGEAQRIHISQATRDLLVSHEAFEIEPRGDISVKGKGMMSTYWLVGKKETRERLKNGLNINMARFNEHPVPELMLSYH